MENENCIYVVGYPKSGNTWLLRMLCDICEANIDASDAINNANYQATRSGLLRKIHFADISDLPKNAKVVYVARDIRDVLVSAFFFNNPFLAEQDVALGQQSSAKYSVCRMYFSHQIKRMNHRWCGNEYAELINWIKNRRTKKEIIGANWNDHVAYWTRNATVCSVRYEDLLLNGKENMEKIMAYLGIGISEEALEKIIQKHSFESAKKNFLQNGDMQNAKFMRKGSLGDWHRFLDESQINEILRINKHGLALMGYEYT